MCVLGGGRGGRGGRWILQEAIHACKVIKINSLNDGNTINQHQCQVIVKDPEKTQDPAGI